MTYSVAPFLLVGRTGIRYAQVDRVLVFLVHARSTAAVQRRVWDVGDDVQ